MAKNKISEFSSNPANNTDIAGIDIAEGCAPSGINNAIRELMAQLKDQQAGTDNDTFTVNGNLTVGSTLTANGSVGVAGQALVSRGAGLSPQWGAGFVSGMIMLWSGSISSIPSGWLLCDGSNSTPDLRNCFVVGAFSDDSGVAKSKLIQSIVSAGSFVSGTSYVIQTLGTTDFTLIGASSNTVGVTFTATGIGSGTGTAITSDTVYTKSGGSKDAIVVAHTHTGTTSNRSLTGSFEIRSSATGTSQVYVGSGITSISADGGADRGTIIGSSEEQNASRVSFNASHDHTFTTAFSGSSGTNANLPPYYALAYIMKA
jgi:hypothetical protein